MYFAQGLPWGFASVTFAAYLVDNGTPVEDIAILFATVALPWTFKWIWGPVVDAVFIEKYGPRRQWVLFAQAGMALTLGSLIFVDDLNEVRNKDDQLMFLFPIQDENTNISKFKILLNHKDEDMLNAMRVILANLSFEETASCNTEDFAYGR